MTVTATETVVDLVTDALLDLEAGTLGQSPDADQMAHGVRHLNRLMKRLQMLGFFQSLKTTTSLNALVINNYALSPARMFRIMNIQYKNTSGIEIPMIELTQEEYAEFPDKSTSGIPTQFYYDRQRESARLYVWPMPASYTSETYEITYEREFEDIADENDTVDFPVEGYDALVLGLAARLRHTYGKGQRKVDVAIEAKNALDEFLASDTEGVVKFYSD